MSALKKSLPQAPPLRFDWRQFDPLRPRAARRQRPQDRTLLEDAEPRVKPVRPAPPAPALAPALAPGRNRPAPEPRAGAAVAAPPLVRGQGRSQTQGQLQPRGQPPGRPAADGGHYAADAFGALWWTRIPGRLWQVIVAATLPLRLLVLVLDGLVAAAMVGLMALAWAWWTHHISDDQVAAVLGQLGQRGLAILTKSGVL